jgi:hypothetical protein
MPAKKQIPAEFHALVVKYVDKQISVADMASVMCCAKATVLKWMDAFGVPRHPPGIMISVKCVGRKSPRLGVKLSEEAKKRMSESRIGIPTKKGFKFSLESREKMRSAALHRIATTDILTRMKKGRERRRMPESERIAIVKTRDACKRMLRRVLTMTRVRKDGRHELLLGYTKADLRTHLERQFSPGMSWLARESFHIDHIKPVAQFFREGVFDPAVINALSNLQVLTPKENRAKSDRFVDSKPRQQVLVIDKLGTRPFL